MSMLIVNIIVYLLFPLLVVHKVSLNRTGYNEDIITRDDSLALRGIAACGIMFSHYVVYLEELGVAVGPAKLYWVIGGMGNCIFFFLSGYGLYASAQKNQPISARFLWRHLKNVYVPYAAMRFVFSFVVLDKSESVLYRVGYILGAIEPHWFINAIMLLYLLFFFSYKIGKSPILTMFILTSLVSFGLFCMRFAARWYNANLIFVFGMLLFEKRKQFIEFMKRRYLLKLALSFTGFLAFSMFYIISDFGVLKTAAGCLLSISGAGLLLKVRFQSPSMHFVGKRSMHWYIVHYMNSWYIAELCFPGTKPVTLFILAILFTIVITAVFFALEQRVWKGLKTTAAIWR